jgi:hypothetical protein
MKSTQNSQGIEKNKNLRKSTKEKEENLKKDTNDNDVVDIDIEACDAKQEHYSIFCLLFMLGFLMHCRKYPHETYSSITMAHIMVFCWVPSVTTTLYQDVTFMSFCSFCLFTMLQDSPYNANHHNM